MLKKIGLIVIFFSFLALAWWLGHNLQQTLQQGQWVDYLERGNQAVDEQKDHQRAFDLYNKALQINPDLPASAKANLGEIYFMAGQIEKAQEFFNSALQKSPDLKETQDLLAAIKLSQETIDSDQSITQKTNTAFDFLQKNQPFLALPILEQVTKKVPQYRDGHYLLAAAYLKTGRFSEAKEEIEKALEIDANFEAGLALQQEIQMISK